MKVDGSMTSLVQGVSQQPARIRLEGQSTSQDNWSSNPVDGLTRRAPTKLIAELFNTSDDIVIHRFISGPNKYFVFTEEENIRVFDKFGVEKTVNIDSGAELYLSTSMVSTTLDGTMFLANKDVTVEMESATYADLLTEGVLITALGGQYGRKYSVTVHWIEGSTEFTESFYWESPNGSQASHTSEISTVNILTKLKAAFDLNTNLTDKFDLILEDNVLYLKRNNSVVDPDFTAVTSDSFDNSVLIAVARSTTATSKLPRLAPQNYVVRITGSETGTQDDWYVRYDIPSDEGGVTYNTGEGFGMPGIWVECPAPDILFSFDKSTMPHVLTYDETTDEFTFGQGDWKNRRVGDEDSNPTPSFVGRTIRDIGSFQGRLCVLAGPYFIASRSNKPFDFWMQSATVLADTDPIDITSTSEETGDMIYMVPFNRDLVLFSEGGGQFIVFGRNIVTPKTAALVLSTSFEVTLDARPVISGRNIFFAMNFGAYTGVREYYTDGTVDVNDSRVITQHVSKYIKGEAKQLTASSNFDILLVHTNSDTNYVYVYEYIWKDDERVQASWSRWIFSNEILFTSIDEAEISLITRTGNTISLEVLNMNVFPDDGLTYNVRLDRKVYVDSVNTTFALPYTEVDPSRLVYVQGEGCPYPGMRVLGTYDEITDTVTLNDDMQGGTVIVGVRYLSSYIPTQPFVRDANGVKIDAGKLVVSKFIVNYRESGNMYARVWSKYRNGHQLYYSGRVIGDPNNLVSEQIIEDGQFKIPFRENTNFGQMEIYTEDHLPLTIMDISWIGQYNKRGERVVGG